MGRHFLGVIGKSQDQRAGGWRVDAAGGDGARLLADRTVGRRRSGRS